MTDGKDNEGNEARALYLLPPCSDAGEGRLWCEHYVDCCEASEGPHDECEGCGGKGQPPTLYVRGDLYESVRSALERATAELRGAASELEECEYVPEMPAEDRVRLERLRARIADCDTALAESLA